MSHGVRLPIKRAQNRCLDNLAGDTTRQLDFPLYIEGTDVEGVVELLSYLDSDSEGGTIEMAAAAHSDAAIEDIAHMGSETEMRNAPLEAQSIWEVEFDRKQEEIQLQPILKKTCAEQETSRGEAAKIAVKEDAEMEWQAQDVGEEPAKLKQHHEKETNELSLASKENHATETKDPVVREHILVTTGPEHSPSRNEANLKEKQGTEPNEFVAFEQAAPAPGLDEAPTNERNTWSGAHATEPIVFVAAEQAPKSIGLDETSTTKENQQKEAHATEVNAIVTHERAAGLRGPQEATRGERHEKEVEQQRDDEETIEFVAFEQAPKTSGLEEAPTKERNQMIEAQATDMKAIVALEKAPEMPGPEEASGEERYKTNGDKQRDDEAALQLAGHERDRELSYYLQRIACIEQNEVQVTSPLVTKLTEAKPEIADEIRQAFGRRVAGLIKAQAEEEVARLTMELRAEQQRGEERLRQEEARLKEEEQALAKDKERLRAAEEEARLKVEKAVRQKAELEAIESWKEPQHEEFQPGQEDVQVKEKSEMIVTESGQLEAAEEVRLLDKKRLETLRLQEDLTARVEAEKQRVAAVTSRRLETIRTEVEQLLLARNQMEQQLRDKVAIRLECQRELTRLLLHVNLPEGVVA